MDYKTATLFFGLIYTLLPIITWFILADERKHEDLLWCGGGALSGLGIVVGAFRESELSMFVTLSLPNGAVFFGTLLKLQALRRELGREWRLATIGGASLLFLLLFELARQRYGMGLLVYLLSGGIVYPALTMMLAWLAREIGRVESSRKAIWLSHSYTLLGATLLLRLVYALISHESMVANPPHFTANLVSLAGTFTTIMSAIGYVGLRLETTGRKLLQARLEQAQNDYARTFGERLAELQRKEIVEQIGVVLGHELKQPLAAIRLDSEFGAALAKPAGTGGTELQNVFSRIQKNAARAGALVEQLMRRSTHARHEMQEVDLGELIVSVIDLLVPQCQQCSAIVRFEPPQQLYKTRGNALEIGQVLVNVLKNAVEAGGAMAHHQVDVLLKKKSDAVVIEVLDRGCGFPEGIFKDLGRGFVTTKPDGLGLGVLIACELAERNRAKLSFENRTGGGAAVVLAFEGG